MEKLEQFKQICEEISKVSSLTKKEEVLSSYKFDTELRDLFSQCFDSNKQTIYLDKKIGLGSKTINKVWPNLIEPFHIMEADEIRFSEGENWLSLVHHLHDYKHWWVAGDQLGIRCKIEITKDRAIPRTAGLDQIKNFDLLDKQLRWAFRAGMILDGRLVSRGAKNIEEVYDDFLKTELLEDHLFFYIYDIISPTAESFDLRYRVSFNSLAAATQVKWLLWAKADFNTYYQLAGIKSVYKKCLLKFNNSPYQFGPNKNFLSLTV